MDAKQIEILTQIGNLIGELLKTAQPSPTIESKPEPIPDPEPRPQPTPEPQSQRPSKSFVDLISSDAWPKAADDDELVKTEEDKYERAEGIIDKMVEHYAEGLKFLDFGCGEGHVSKTICSQKPLLSVGYDIVKPDNLIVPWEEKTDNLLLTADYDKVIANGPYDIILLYDVLDHCVDPVEALQKIKSLIHDKSKVFIRCHPWCSRHGGHLYHKLNKAFVHLFLTDTEIQELTGESPMFVQKILYPVIQYSEWFKNAGLKVKQSNTDRNYIDPFFQKNQLVRNHIFGIWGRQPNEQFPKHQLEQSFLDFIVINGN